jgi:hypothetical protein
MPDDEGGAPEQGRESVQPPAAPAGRRDRVAAAEDLRTTGESILADAQRLAAIEIDKMALDPDDPQVDHLSDDAIDLAHRLEHETRVERQLSAELE